MQYQICKVSEQVFRAYDIRGIIHPEFSEDAFYTIGLTLAATLQDLQRQDVFLAQDGRLTSPSLAQALQQGLLDGGMRVFDLGMVPTPVMYFATKVPCKNPPMNPIDSGVMITGSHNPSAYNGIKMVLAGNTLAQADIENLYTRMQQGVLPAAVPGTLHSVEVLPDYSQTIVERIHFARPMTVVVDCGNGVAGVTVPAVLERLGARVIPLYTEVDGHFPNHHPDPTQEKNLVDLKEAVRIHQADIGLAFDGDGDRLGVVTNTGEMIYPDRLLLFFAQALLAEHPQATIVFDVKCTQDLADSINAQGGIPHMCPTGHSIVKRIMKEKGALLAGEMSGHIFFQDRWYGFDDALFSACRLLELLSLKPESVAEQFASIPKRVSTPEIQITMEDEHKFAFIEKLREQGQFDSTEHITIDGLRVAFERGWGLLRASNTTPCVTARFEALDLASLEDIQRIFKREMQRILPDLAIPF
ncbi:MAG: phosphomannomutase/phosphoglucomutase [Legionellaceae bacterium]|nr:phosphomannomutase/phosphoglucomutase [Legionellaceae bacterium]